LIPKNTSVIVARVPVNTNQYNKRWADPQASGIALPSNALVTSEQNASENVDLSKMNGSEEDKIQAMMVQSTLDYDPSR
jgi:E3 ubiquitin-protein ligase RBBP6